MINWHRRRLGLEALEWSGAMHTVAFDYETYDERVTVLSRAISQLEDPVEVYGQNTEEDPSKAVEDMVEYWLDAPSTDTDVQIIDSADYTHAAITWTKARDSDVNQYMIILGKMRK